MQSLFLLILKKIEHHLKVTVTVKRVSGSFIENAILAPAYLSYFFRNIYFFLPKNCPWKPTQTYYFYKFYIYQAKLRDKKSSKHRNSVFLHFKQISDHNSTSIFVR